MTRQHFTAIARALCMSRDEMPAAAHRLLCERMASELRAFNPAFDAKKFLKACGCIEA